MKDKIIKELKKKSHDTMMKWTTLNRENRILADNQLSIMEALILLLEQETEFPIVVYQADKEVITAENQNNNIK